MDGCIWCIRLHQILSLFSSINLAYVLEINIFGRDYSNLNNLFQRYYLQYINKVYCRQQGQNLMQQKKDSFGITFYKNILSAIFFNLVPKEFFAPQGTFTIKLTGVYRISVYRNPKSNHHLLFLAVLPDLETCKLYMTSL